MKKITSFFGGLLVAATMMFVSCGKDIVPTINNYFSVDNATLVAKEMPEATLSGEVQLSMNDKVIPGGTSYVAVNSEIPAAKILVGMKDQKGYYEAPANAQNGVYSFVMVVNQDITLGDKETGIAVQVALQDANGNVSPVVENFVELLTTVGTGTLQVSLSFDNAKDVDLHLIEPEQVDADGNELSFDQRHICYFNSISMNGGELDLDSNAGCGIDNINNENITYSEEAYVAPGLYQVYVDMFENCDPQDTPTNWVVSVYYKGALIASQSGGNPVHGTFAADVPGNYSNLNNLRPVMTFVVPDEGQHPVKTFAPKPLTPTALQKQALTK